MNQEDRSIVKKHLDAYLQAVEESKKAGEIAAKFKKEQEEASKKFVEMSAGRLKADQPQAIGDKVLLLHNGRGRGTGPWVEIMDIDPDPGEPEGAKEAAEGSCASCGCAMCTQDVCKLDKCPYCTGESCFLCHTRGHTITSCAHGPNTRHGQPSKEEAL